MVVSTRAQTPARQLPLVWVLATGGTISGKGATSTSLTDYRSGSLAGEELVAAVPEIAQVARIEVEQVANVSSTDITTAHWLTLARRIDELFASDPNGSGVVVTHGTNTLEETAYFLNLTVRHDRPVVLVGAMPGRGPSAASGCRRGPSPSDRTPRWRRRGRCRCEWSAPAPAVLMLALTRTRDRDEIRRMFRQY